MDNKIEIAQNIIVGTSIASKEKKKHKIVIFNV